MIEFQKKDIERSDVVKKIIDIYDFNYDKINNETNRIAIPLLKDIKNTINPNNNYTNSTNVKYNRYNIIDNDAALIPKHHIIRNNDIFFDNSIL